MDTYENFFELQECECEEQDFRVRIQKVPNASTVIFAPHGGGIEPGTSELTIAIAGDDLSFGAFEGIKGTGNSLLHITSTNFDEPRCLELILAHRYVVTIHGEENTSQTVFLGGRDEYLCGALHDALQISKFNVATHDDPRLQGKNARNVCNRGASNSGVQLELSNALRASFFQSLSAVGRRHPTPKLDRFCEAVREGLRRVGAL